MQVLLVPVQFVKTRHFIMSQLHFVLHPMNPQASPFFSAYTHKSQSLISVVFINPISFSCSSLPEAHNADADIQPLSHQNPSSIQHLSRFTAIMTMLRGYFAL